MMVDSDDTLEPDRIIPLINRMEAERLDLLTFGIYDIIDGKRHTQQRQRKAPQRSERRGICPAPHHRAFTMDVYRASENHRRPSLSGRGDHGGLQLLPRTLRALLTLIAHSPDGVYNYIIRQGIGQPQQRCRRRPTQNALLGEDIGAHGLTAVDGDLSPGRTAVDSPLQTRSHETARPLPTVDIRTAADPSHTAPCLRSTAPDVRHCRPCGRTSCA